MSSRFEELGWAQTSIGEISLRRRKDPSLGVEVYEVKLGDEYLMSSLFTVAEIELATLGLAASTGDPLDVVVGGLGLGFTARAVLRDPRVRQLFVVETLDAVIDWHKQALLPDAAEMVADPRCRLVAGDFFALVAAGDGFGDGTEGLLDAILVDIDHTPHHVLHPSHAAFYTVLGLERLAARLAPAGVFALWSDDPPDDAFLAVLGTVFATTQAHVVRFPNPITGGESTNTVYVATRS